MYYFGTWCNKPIIYDLGGPMSFKICSIICLFILSGCSTDNTCSSCHSSNKAKSVHEKSFDRLSKATGPTNSHSYSPHIGGKVAPGAKDFITGSVASW